MISCGPTKRSINIIHSESRVFKVFQFWLWTEVKSLSVNLVLTNFPYKLLWTIMDTLLTVVITQPQSIVVGKHFTVTIIKLLNVISRIPIIHLLPLYFCTNSWNVRAAICLEGRFSLLALSSVYSLAVKDGSWSTPMVPPGTVVCPLTTGRWIGTETCEMDNVFPPDDLLFGLDTNDTLYECTYIYIYICIYIYIYIKLCIWILDIGRNMQLCVCWWGKGVVACPSQALVLL